MSILSKILVTLLCSCKSAEATAELRKIIRHFREAASEASDEVEDEIKPIMRSSRTSSRGSKRRYCAFQHILYIHSQLFLKVNWRIMLVHWHNKLTVSLGYFLHQKNIVWEDAFSLFN